MVHGPRPPRALRAPRVMAQRLDGMSGAHAVARTIRCIIAVLFLSFVLMAQAQNSDSAASSEGEGERLSLAMLLRECGSAPQTLGKSSFTSTDGVRWTSLATSRSFALPQCNATAQHEQGCSGVCAEAWSSEAVKDFISSVDSATTVTAASAVTLTWQALTSLGGALPVDDGELAALPLTQCENTASQLLVLIITSRAVDPSATPVCVGLGATSVSVQSSARSRAPAAAAAPEDDSMADTDMNRYHEGPLSAAWPGHESGDASVELKPWIRPENNYSEPLPWETAPVEVANGPAYGDGLLPNRTDQCLRNETESCRVTIANEVFFEYNASVHENFIMDDPGELWRPATRQDIRNYTILSTFPLYGTVFLIEPDLLSAVPIEVGFRDLPPEPGWMGTGGIRVYINGIAAYTFKRASRKVMEHRPMSVSLWDRWGSKRGVYLMTIVPLDPWGNEGTHCSSTAFAVMPRPPIPPNLRVQPNVTHPDLVALHLMAAGSAPGGVREGGDGGLWVGVALPPDAEQSDLTGPRGLLFEVWILNLDRRRDRWDAMRRALCLDFLQLGCRRFPALDAARDPTVYANVHESCDGARNIGFGMLTDAEVAITYGLMEMLQQVVLFKLGAAILVEDDVAVNPLVTRAQFQDVLRRVPPDADLVYLGYCHEAYHDLPAENATAEDYEMYEKVPFKLGYAYCNHALLVGHKGARKMLDVMDHNGSRFHDACKSRILKCYLAAFNNPDGRRFFGNGILLQDRTEFGTDNQRPWLQF